MPRTARRGRALTPTDTIAGSQVLKQAALGRRPHKCKAFVYFPSAPGESTQNTEERRGTLACVEEAAGEAAAEAEAEAAATCAATEAAEAAAEEVAFEATLEAREALETGNALAASSAEPTAVVAEAVNAAAAALSKARAAGAAKAASRAEWAVTETARAALAARAAALRDIQGQARAELALLDDYLRGGPGGGESSDHGGEREANGGLRARNDVSPAGQGQGGETAARTYGCEVTTVSDAIAELEWDGVDLLKLDVEGDELAALKGVRDEHWPTIRQVVCEVKGVDGRLGAVEALLASHGFTVRTEIQRETANERGAGGGEGHGGGGGEDGGFADVYVAFTPGAAELYYVYATRV